MRPLCLNDDKVAKFELHKGHFWFGLSGQGTQKLEVEPSSFNHREL